MRWPGRSGLMVRTTSREDPEERAMAAPPTYGELAGRVRTT